MVAGTAPSAAMSVAAPGAAVVDDARDAEAADVVDADRAGPVAAGAGVTEGVGAGAGGLGGVGSAPLEGGDAGAASGSLAAGSVTAACFPGRGCVAGWLLRWRGLPRTVLPRAGVSSGMTWCASSRGRGRDNAAARQSAVAGCAGAEVHRAAGGASAGRCSVDRCPAGRKSATHGAVDRSPADRYSAAHDPAGCRSARRWPAACSYPADQDPADQDPADHRPASHEPADHGLADPRPGGRSPCWRPARRRPIDRSPRARYPDTHCSISGCVRAWSGWATGAGRETRASPPLPAFAVAAVVIEPARAPRAVPRPRRVPTGCRRTPRRWSHRR